MPNRALNFSRLPAVLSMAVLALIRPSVSSAQTPADPRLQPAVATNATPIIISPTSLTFSPQKIDSFSAAQTVTFSISTSDSNLFEAFVPTLEGPDAGDFVWASAREGGYFLYVTLAFAPRTPGSKSATIVVTDTSTNTIAATATVSGIGVLTGTFEILSFNGKALEPAGGSRSNGTYIEQTNSTGKGSQSWNLRQNSDGFYTVVNALTGKVLDDTGYSLSDGTPVQQWEDLGERNQQWLIQAVDDVHFSIVNRLSGKALDVPGASSMERTVVQQWAPGTQQQQLWTFVPPEPLVLFGIRLALAMEVTGGSIANGAGVQGWHSNGNKQQQWQFMPVGGGYYAILNQSSGKAMDLIGGSTENGALAQQYDYLGGANQQWKVRPVMTYDSHAFYTRGLLVYQFENRASGKQLYLLTPEADGSVIRQGPSGTTWQIAALPAYTIQSVFDNKVLDIPFGTAANGTTVQQWEINGSLQQQWRIAPILLGPYPQLSIQIALFLGSSCPCALVNVASGKVLEVPGSSTTDGTIVDQADYVNAANQQWTGIRSNYTSNSVQLSNNASGKVLDVTNASSGNGTLIQQYTPLGGANQLWQLVLVMP